MDGWMDEWKEKEISFIQQFFVESLLCAVVVQILKGPPSIGKIIENAAHRVEPCGMGRILPGRNEGDACQMQDQRE